MCGRAEALGIEINIPQDSRTFFKDRIYGVIDDGKEIKNIQQGEKKLAL